MLCSGYQDVEGLWEGYLIELFGCDSLPLRFSMTKGNVQPMVFVCAYLTCVDEKASQLVRND